MTTPDQNDEHGRTTGGVRNAINDLLGRNDHDERTARTDDDRTDPAGSTAPTGARVEGQHADARLTDAHPADARPLDAPTGARFEGQPVEPQHQQDTHLTGSRTIDPRTTDSHPADPRTGDSHLAGSRTAGDGVVGAAAPEQHTVGDRRPDGPATSGPTPGSARHTDIGDGPGYAAPAQGQAAGHGSGTGAGTVAATSQGEDSEGRERLVSTDRAESYGSRWDAVKGEFVDEPRKAVADADALVGELLEELQTLFTQQRQGIERSLAADETSTEDMRLALRRYRSFFDRLLSI